MLFAKIKEKLLNRRNDIEISEITDDSGTPLDAEKMFALLSKVSINTDGEVEIEALKLTSYLLANEIECNLINFVDDNGEERLFPLQDNAGKLLAVNEDEDGLVALPILPQMTATIDEDNLIHFTLPKPYVPTLIRFGVNDGGAEGNFYIKIDETSIAGYELVIFDEGSPTHYFGLETVSINVSGIDNNEVIISFNSGTPTKVDIYDYLLVIGNLEIDL